MERKGKKSIVDKIDEGKSSKLEKNSNLSGNNFKGHSRESSQEFLNQMLHDLRQNRLTRVNCLISNPINSKSLKESKKPIKTAIFSGNFLTAQELKQKGFYVSPRLFLEVIKKKDQCLIENIIKHNLYSPESLQLAFWSLLYNRFVQSAHDLIDEEDSLKIYSTRTSFIGEQEIEVIIHNKDLLETAFEQALIFGEDETACCLLRTSVNLIKINRIKQGLETGCVDLLRMVWSGDLSTEVKKISSKKNESIVWNHLKSVESSDDLEQIHDFLSPLSLLNYYLTVKKLQPCLKIIQWPGVKDDYEALQIILENSDSTELAVEFISNTHVKLTTEDLFTALSKKQYRVCMAILRKISRHIHLNSNEFVKELIKMLDTSETSLLSIEILSRMNLKKINPLLYRQINITLSTFIKKKIDLMYCEAPVLFCVLTAEFLIKLSHFTKQYKSRCIRTSELFIDLGVSFEDSISDEKSLKYYMTHTDTRNRSVLEIIAKNRFYDMLNHDNIGVLVTKLWIGSESDFGIHKAPSLMASLLAPEGSDESNQFMKGIDTSKPYSFQFEKWTQACSHRYMANSFSVLVLIIVYQLYLYALVDSKTMLKYEGNSYDMGLYIFILVMVFGISCENLLRIIFMVKTRGKVRFDMWQVNDWIISLLIVFISVEIPEKCFKNGWVSYERAYLGSGIIHSVMLCMLCMKYVNMIMTSKSFGPFLSMILLIFKEIFTFLMIYTGVTLCFSGIFTLLFGDTPGYESLDVSLRTMYMAAIGPFVIDTFTENKLAFGAVMLAVYLLLSHVLLLNLLVGIVTNVFTVFQQKIESDYRATLINTYYENLWSERCGILVFLPTPFTAISVILAPLVLGPESEKTNKRIARILYLVYGIPYFIVFLFLSLVALPFIFLKGFLIYGKTGKQVQEVLHTNIFEVIDEAPREIVTKFSYGKSFSWMVIGIPWLFFAVVRDLVQFWKIAYFETPVTADLGITTVVDQNFLRNFQKTLKFIQSEKVSCEEFYRIFQQFDEVTDPDINHEREEEIMKILKQFSSPVFDYNIEVLKIRKIFPKKVVGLYEMKDLENFSQFNLPWICKGLTSFQKKNGTIVKLKKMKMKNQNYHLKFDQEIEKVENAVKVHRKKIREALRDCRVIFRRFNKEIT